MKLARVTVIHSVPVDGNNSETIYDPKGERNLRFEAGFFLFEDAAGRHIVPASNVRCATLADEGAKKK